MKNKIYLLVFVAVFFGCKKTETPAVSAKLDLIAGEMAKDWFIRNAVVGIDQNGTDRQIALLLDCESDDKWTFNRDGSLIVNDNLSKCQGQPAERLNTLWTADDTFDNMTIVKWQLSNSGAKSNVIFEIKNLTDSTMTLSGGSGLLTNTNSITINYRTR